MLIEFWTQDNPSMDLCDAVASSAPGNPFYTRAYLESMRGLGFQPFLLGLTENGNVTSGCSAFLRSGLLNRSLELPSLPLLRESATFWNGVLKFCVQTSITHLEINSYASLAAEIPPLAEQVYSKSRREYVLALQGVDLWQQLDKKHKQSIKRAQAGGVTLGCAADEPAVEQHLCLVGQAMERHKLRGERVPREIDPLVIKILLGTGAGRLYQAMQGTQVLSSVLITMASQGAYYHYSGTGPEGLACGASHFLLHEIAGLLQEEGMKTFNLGGAGDDNPGLERFKVRFGATPVELQAAEFYLGSKTRSRVSSAVKRIRSVVRK
jgi:hypothetical protein